MSALVEGYFIQVGSPTALLATDTRDVVAAARAAADAFQERGHTAVVVLCEHRPVGVLAITDQVRAEPAPTVAAVTRLTGAAPVLLTTITAPPPPDSPPRSGSPTCVPDCCLRTRSPPCANWKPVDSG